MENNYYISKSKKFKTNYIQIRFELPAILENTTNASLLSMYLTHCNNIDKDYKAANDTLDLLYGSKFDINISMKGKIITFDFLISFIASRYLDVDDKYIDKVIKTLSTYVFNPLENDDSFDEDIFNLKKNDLSNRLKMAYDDKSSYALETFYEIMGKDYPLGLNVSGYQDELALITPQSLYHYYQTLIARPYVILGDINHYDYELVISKLDESFNSSLFNYSNIIYHLDHKNNNNEVIVNQDIVQSKVIIGYYLDELITNDQYYINLVFNSIFGMGSNSYLFKIVREQENLCYSINSMYDHYSNVFIIMAGIEKSNYQKTINLVAELINKIANEEVEIDELIDAKTVLCDVIRKTCDTQGAHVNYIANRSIINFNKNLDYDLKKIQEVKMEDVVAVAQRLVCKTKFLLSGDKNE